MLMVDNFLQWMHLKVPGESKIVYAFSMLWNKKYVTHFQIEAVNLSVKG